MAVGLESVISGKETKPPRVIIYGPKGIGKTTFACAAKDPIVIQTEDGIGVLDAPRFPLAADFQSVIDAITTLYTSEHSYKTVVLDSLDWCERLVHDKVRSEHGEKIFAEYGRGYTLAVTHFERLVKGFNALRDEKNMTVVLVAHSAVKRFESPDVEPFDRYKIDLHDKSSSLFEEWSDVILFANQKIYTTTSDAGFGRKTVRGVGTGERVMYSEERPSHVAKNRYSLPYEMPLEWAAFARAIGAAMRPQQQQQQTQQP